MAKIEAIREAVQALVLKGEEILEAAEGILDEATSAEGPEYQDGVAEKINYDYNKWYSQALTLVSRNLPEREADFREIHDGREGNTGLKTRARKVLLNFTGSPLEFPIREFREGLVAQLGILDSIGDVLDLRAMDIRQVLSADLLQDELETATHLLENGFTRPAGILAGVALERHLKLMCEVRNQKLGERETIGTINEKLKEHYQDPAHVRKVAWMAAVRAKCGHDKGAEPEAGSIQELIDSVQKFVSTVS